jgi:monooxygenase
MRFPASSSSDRIGSHVDVVIVGAGVSGIGVACHLKTRMPGKTFAILEARDSIGGTWDLFRYPGIRSDSDMHTYGYAFRPWRSENTIAGAGQIVDYLRATVEEYDLSRHIRLGHRVLGAAWSSREARWTVRVRRDGAPEHELTCGMLVAAAGYFDYDSGYTPRFAGRDDFQGAIVHPQHWPEDLDYAGKRVVVIGSGATAVTLIPAMAEKAAHVTMLQRSPSYLLALPGRDPIARALRRMLPQRIADRLTRRVMLARMRWSFVLCQRYPRQARRVLRWLTARQLPPGFPVDTHFNPSYDPWDERLCLVPSGDLFKAIRRGEASIVTDRIARFTRRGILLESGTELEADVIVTATGLNLSAFGKLALTADGASVAFDETLIYKAVMLSGVPNFVPLFGYTREASWTVKIDLVGRYLCRLLDHMDRHGYDAVVPVADDPTLERSPMLDLRSGYVQRSVHAFPKRGSHGPWTLDMKYATDRARLLEAPVEDPALRFATRTRSALRLAA